ncbi:MAG: histidine kinase, partial [Gammaproteobacteria bacterium]|nr:histidine kinase [Gammaproteobacteria bacterium]
MSGLRYRYQTVEIDNTDIHLRTLRDTQQFADINGAAEKLGVSPSSWPLFGIVWDSGKILAHLMQNHDIEGKRILEVGCGMALSSLILNRRFADITATDYHPEAERFLINNVKLNDGRPIPFYRSDWNSENRALGEFDLIIGSDILYEPDHARLLSGFINRHAKPECEVIIVDP